MPNGIVEMGDLETTPAWTLMAKVNAFFFFVRLGRQYLTATVGCFGWGLHDTFAGFQRAFKVSPAMCRQH